MDRIPTLASAIGALRQADISLDASMLSEPDRRRVRRDLERDVGLAIVQARADGLLAERCDNRFRPQRRTVRDLGLARTTAAEFVAFASVPCPVWRQLLRQQTTRRGVYALVRRWLDAQPGAGPPGFPTTATSPASPPVRRLPPEARTLLRTTVQQRRDAGASYAQIGREFELAGLPTPRGGAWHPASVRALVVDDKPAQPR